MADGCERPTETPRVGDRVGQAWAEQPNPAIERVALGARNDGLNHLPLLPPSTPSHHLGAGGHRTGHDPHRKPASPCRCLYRHAPAGLVRGAKHGQPGAGAAPVELPVAFPLRVDAPPATALFNLISMAATAMWPMDRSCNNKGGWAATVVAEAATAAAEAATAAAETAASSGNNSGNEMGGDSI